LQQCKILQEYWAHKIISLWEWEMPAFISPDTEPPNSPHLNPADYKIWQEMQQQLYQTVGSWRWWTEVAHVWCGFEQSMISNIINESTQRAETSANAKIWTKSTRDANLVFRINTDPDPGVCRICPKMLWMHYLVGISHFAEYGTNRLLDCMRNANKCPKINYYTMVKNVRITTKS